LVLNKRRWIIKGRIDSLTNDIKIEFAAMRFSKAMAQRELTAIRSSRPWYKGILDECDAFCLREQRFGLVSLNKYGPDRKYRVHFFFI
jgi:hypothetical protein